MLWHRECFGERPAECMAPCYGGGMHPGCLAPEGMDISDHLRQIKRLRAYHPPGWPDRQEE